MDARQNFWLDLHHLAQSIERQGTTPTERSDEILDALAEQSPDARKESLTELTIVLVELQLLHSLARVEAAQQQAQSRRRFSKPVQVGTKSANLKSSRRQTTQPPTQDQTEDEQLTTPAMSEMR
jgi:hypothetical protein